MNLIFLAVTKLCYEFNFKLEHAYMQHRHR